ncbi:hypothetical protein JOD03_002563 [Chryseomicrobium aureum]|nr:hypothetical protein [Chryseomicrobium aureum]
MNWYEKLNQYFPVEEMKSKEHMDALLNKKIRPINLAGPF